jgi:hypothetical protein
MDKEDRAVRALREAAAELRRAEAARRQAALEAGEREAMASEAQRSSQVETAFRQEEAERRESSRQAHLARSLLEPDVGPEWGSLPEPPEVVPPLLPDPGWSVLVQLQAGAHAAMACDPASAAIAAQHCRQLQAWLALQSKLTVDAPPDPRPAAGVGGRGPLGMPAPGASPLSEEHLVVSIAAPSAGQHRGIVCKASVCCTWQGLGDLSQLRTLELCVEGLTDVSALAQCANLQRLVLNGKAHIQTARLGLFTGAAALCEQGWLVYGGELMNRTYTGCAGGGVVVPQ